LLDILSAQRHLAAPLDLSNWQIFHALGAWYENCFSCVCNDVYLISKGCSQIGAPIEEPWVAAVQVKLQSGVDLQDVEGMITDIVQAELTISQPSRRNACTAPYRSCSRAQRQQAEVRGHGLRRH
jgi:hypothetical protein